MANFKGGSTKGVDVLVRVFTDDNGKIKGQFKNKNDKDFVMVNAQVLQDPENPQSNPNLATYKGKDGKFSNGIAYSPPQLAAIMERAGDNHTPIMSKDGKKQIGTLYAVNTDIILKPATTSKNGNTFPGHAIINTKALRPSEYKVGPETLTTQYALTKQAAEAAKAAKVDKSVETETTVSGPVFETPEAPEAPESSVVEPEFD